MLNFSVSLHYDDMEVCNPLGSNVKRHKLGPCAMAGLYNVCAIIGSVSNKNTILGLFYFTLGNIKPKFRSTLQVIQLLCAVKTEYINKYGIDEILEPFMSAINELESVSSPWFNTELITYSFKNLNKKH